MLLNEYETVIIVRPDLDDSDTFGILDGLDTVVTEHDGHVLLRDDWGKRKLAYAIKRHLKGHYFVVNYLAPNDLVLEYERKIRIEDRIIRFLTVKLADAVDVPVRLEQAAEVRRVKEEEARARAAAEAEAKAQAEAAQAAREQRDQPPQA